MKSQKPILILLLLCLLPLLAGCSALPAEGQCGADVKWSFYNGILTISGTGDMQDWKDASHWEDRAKYIVKVVVEEGVTSIGDYAFSGCVNLTDAVLPQSLRRIGVWAFIGCERLSEVKLPEGVESINLAAFGNSGLKSVSIPATVKDIESAAFAICKDLTDISVAEGSAAYADIDGVLLNADKTVLLQYPSGKPMTEYTVPDGVQTIGSGALSDAFSLEAITLPDGLKTIESYAFAENPKLKSLTIPEGVTEIGEGAFMFCAELESVTLPSTLEVLNETALMDCKKLLNIHVTEGGQHFSSVDGVLFNADKTRLLKYPEARPAAEYTVPDGVTEIGSSAFEGCKGLQSAVLPQGLQAIGVAAFASSGLKYVDLPSSLTTIGYSAFSICDSLESITIPAGVTTIDRLALADCKSLTSVTFEGVETPVDMGELFWGGSDKLVIKGLEGSVAEKYAAKNDIPFEAIPAE